MAVLWAGLCGGDFNVPVEHLPLSGKKQRNTASEQILPLTGSNMSPRHLCKYQSIKGPSERPLCCLLMAPGEAPVPSVAILYKQSLYPTYLSG